MIRRRYKPLYVPYYQHWIIWDRRTGVIVGGRLLSYPDKHIAKAAAKGLARGVRKAKRKPNLTTQAEELY